MLFINPAVDPETQPELFNPFIYKSFPTAIGYLAGYLRHNSHIKPLIWDEQINFLDKQILGELIGKVPVPKIIGITCLTGTSSRAFKISRLIKEIDKSLIIIMGGIHPTALPEECLDRSAADIIVRGEGEITLKEIHDALCSGSDWSNIPGISFRKKNTIIHNPPRSLIDDLYEFPPFPYDLFADNIDRYKDFGTIISSRGCPFNCIFCSQRLISGQKYRFLPTERVISKIKLLVEKYNQRKIFFVDDTFTINHKRTYELLDAIISTGLNKKVGFIVESRAKEINWELLVKMKEANVLSIAYGVETGSERLMSTLNKKETVQDNIDAIHLTHRAGIAADASLIFGLPTETKHDRKITSRLVRKLPLDGARFNIAIPYPGTHFYQTAIKEKRLNKKDDWINFSNQHYLMSDNLPYSPVGTGNSQLVFEVFMANILYMVRPKILRNLLFSPFMSGGTVLSINKNWYTSPHMFYKIIKLLMFLLKRAMIITFKGGILAKLKKYREKHDEDSCKN
jgi:anaerobic magnesium-protoporphyrin IX monomethyl ester cyclase